MDCKNLMNMKELHDGIRLVSGEKGLNRQIRWIYFADCSQCLSEDTNMADLIHGEELVIVTNTSLTNDDNKILEMIKSMQEKDIAGFVINEGQISEQVKQYCEEINLPLFELSISLHLIDLSQAVCRALIEEESTANSRERILSSILYADHIDREELREQAEYLGIPLGEQERIVVLKEFQPEMSEKVYIRNETEWINIQKMIRKEIKNEFVEHGLDKEFILLQENMAIILLKKDMPDDKLLVDILNNIIDRIEKKYHMKIRAGIGNSYSYIEEYRKSFQEAKSTVQISQIVRRDEKVLFYENLGIYSLLNQVQNEKFLDEYVDNCIGKLIKADQLQEGELCKTLEAYLNHNCNANATAEDFYIHRNTMRYRMEKIKKILDKDINDMSVCLELKLAFIIQKYRGKEI